MNVSDEVLLPTPNGTFQGRIVNINEYRPPEMKYAIQIYNYVGYWPDDGLIFVGDASIIQPR